MAYVPVPKDLTNVKTKVLFNLTKRQLICFGSGALVGVPLFFALKSHTGVSTAAISMILVMLPFFLFAMYERLPLCWLPYPPLTPFPSWAPPSPTSPPPWLWTLRLTAPWA